MTSDIFDLTNILLLAVAVAIFLRLRSVLGRRTGDEETRLGNYARDAASTRDNVVPLPRAEPRPGGAPSAGPSVDERLANVPEDSAVRAPLRQIATADPSFDTASFVNGAKIAYESIITAYAKGDRETLRHLLAPEVFDSFNVVINDREASGETVEFHFVGISSSEIVEAQLLGRVAQVKVRFVSDLVTATRDKHGEVVDGDDKAVRQVTDIWTFSRDVSSPNPNWQLVATDAA
ncbi:calcium-binding protein [Rhodomicrobium udaipurense JA643]|uniref:Tim44 domain-containing protein n=1 Tax=Rhodomicrobium udaipurense TaxID=1202716 RepID=A0A8I1G9V4_9HYPH|nr:Tim44/TimA family putative adaptor protein [Rhodomicrobium udaipurense]KAI95859.1 calcium-binding protein [Rhodomicrobium udaipurense JA643]MBJ7543197.1 Tim44 domain-containing protein [Rhodomicrobium udaipurense]